MIKIKYLHILTAILSFYLLHTPGETPDHTLIHIPELKAVFIGDNYYTSFPNLYTLRGTRPRWALDYIGALEKAQAFYLPYREIK